MDYSISLQNKNPRRAITVVTVALLAFALVACRHDGVFDADAPAVELDILCHSEHAMDVTYENPIWERHVDGSYESFGGKLPVNFFVVIHNNKQLPLCVYRPQYSFGYFDLHFECLSNDKVTRIVRHDGVRWPKNIPEKSVVQPGSSLAIPVCLDKSLWGNVPEVTISEWGEVSGDQCMIRAIMTNGMWKVGSSYEWATPHVLTSQWTTVSLFFPKRDVGWERK